MIFAIANAAVVGSCLLGIHALYRLHKLREDFLPWPLCLLMGGAIFFVAVAHIGDVVLSSPHRIRVVLVVMEAWGAGAAAYAVHRVLPVVSELITRRQVTEVLRAADVGQRTCEAMIANAPPEVQPIVQYAVSGVRDRRLSRRLREVSLGICEVNEDCVVEEIDGGAIEHTGTSREAWIGNRLESPQYVQSVAAALRGETINFAEKDPVRRSRPMLVQYSPRTDALGEIDGALIAWIIGKVGQLFLILEPGQWAVVYGPDNEEIARHGADSEGES